jgi:hypothetical protein
MAPALQGSPALLTLSGAHVKSSKSQAVPGSQSEPAELQ